MSANIVNHNNASNAENATPTKKSDNADAGSAATLSPAANDISAKAENNKKTPAKRTPSKRLSYIERAQKESEELVRTMGGTLELEGGRRTRSSARGTPTAQTPPPVKKARTSPATNTPRGRGRGRKLDTPDSEIAKEELSEQLVETSPKSKERKQSLSTIDEDKPDITETDAVLSEQADDSQDADNEVVKANSIDNKITETTSEAEPMDTYEAASPVVAEATKPEEKTVESHKENAMNEEATTTTATIQLDSEEDTMDEHVADVAASDEADAVVEEETQNAAKDDAKTLTTTTTTTVPAVVSEISSADNATRTTSTTTITTIVTASKTASNESEETENHKNGVTNVELETDAEAEIVAEDNIESSNNNNEAAQKDNTASLEATLATGDAASKLQNEICEQKNCATIEATAAAVDVGEGDEVTN